MLPRAIRIPLLILIGRSRATVAARPLEGPEPASSEEESQADSPFAPQHTA